MRLFKVFSWSAVRINDAFREKVPNGFALPRYVGCKYMIEAAVLANDDDDVFNRCDGVVVGVRLLLRRGSAGQRSANRELKECNGRKAKTYSLRHVGCKILEMHSSSLFFCGALLRGSLVTPAYCCRIFTM